MGIIGAGSGTGVTHLTVWMANYLVGVRRERTAVLEWNQHDDFRKMELFCTGSEGVCRILDVDYYAGAKADELIRCMNADYRRILVDFGEISEESLRECARCDRKLILGALNEWRIGRFLEEFRRKGERDRSWNYAAAFGSEETRKELEKTLHRTCLRIPYSADAFAVTRPDVRFFERMMNCLH